MLHVGFEMARVVTTFQHIHHGNTEKTLLCSGGDVSQRETVNFLALCDPLSGATASNTKAVAAATLQRPVPPSSPAASSQLAELKDQKTVGALSDVGGTTAVASECTVPWGYWSIAWQPLLL